MHCHTEHNVPVECVRRICPPLLDVDWRWDGRAVVGHERLERAVHE